MQTERQRISHFPEGLVRTTNRDRMQVRRSESRQNRGPIEALAHIAQPGEVDYDRLPAKKIRLLLTHPIQGVL